MPSLNKLYIINGQYSSPKGRPLPSGIKHIQMDNILSRYPQLLTLPF